MRIERLNIKDRLTNVSNIRKPKFSFKNGDKKIISAPTAVLMIFINA